MSAPLPFSPSRRRVLLLAAWAPALLMPLRSAVAQEGGLVAWIQGAATASRDGASRPLHAGAAVRVGDSIVTQPGARLRLGFPDGSTLAIGEASRVVLTRLDGNADGLVFDLLAGIVRAVLGSDPPDIFAVRGRAAVAAARSTDFIVETTARETAVFAVSGTVGVEAAYGEGGGLLRAGDGIDIARGRPAGEVHPWGERRIADVLARTATGG